MPLIDVTTRPDWALELSDAFDIKYDPEETRELIRYGLCPQLPRILVSKREKLGMDLDTPENGVQIQFHDFGPDDINVPQLWIKVQFSEDAPERCARTSVRDELFKIVTDLFHLQGMKMPDEFMLDVFWGPTHGCGMVNGTYIEW